MDVFWILLCGRQQRKLLSSFLVVQGPPSVRRADMGDTTLQRINPYKASKIVADDTFFTSIENEN